MKIVHTSDWHLGAKLHESDRAEDQKAFLGFLEELLAKERPDALVVAGDIFDTRAPSAGAQSLYYRFLGSVCRANSCGMIVLTAGNHDSASMLSAPKELVEMLDIRIVAKASEDAKDEIVLLRREDGTPGLAIAAIPFINESELSNFARAAGVQCDDPRERAAAGFRIHCGAAISAARDAAVGAPVVALGHCAVDGATPSDRKAERSRQIGGVESQGVDAFKGADYVALGHLHIPQQVGKDGRILYSGSPVPMSFSEAGQRKSVVVAEFGEKAGGPVSLRRVEIPEFTPLRALSGTREEILSGLGALIAEFGREKPVFLSARVVEGEGDLHPFWERIDAAVSETKFMLLSKEDGRERKIEAGLAAESATRLKELSPRDVAERRLNEANLTDEEKAEYLGMVDLAIREAEGGAE